MNKSIYELTGSLSDIETAIEQMLQENYASLSLADRTVFASKDTYCKVNSYCVFSLLQRGYITVNVYFFWSELASDKFQVKVSAFSPLFEDNAGKARKVKQEIEAVLLSHGAVRIEQE